MNVFIDESGSFVSAPSRGSWNVVAAVVAPETSRRDIENVITRLKLSLPSGHSREVKLKSLSEEQYLSFLDSLSHTQITLFATATDAGLNTTDHLKNHQKLQVENLRSNIPRMKYEGGRNGIALLANQLEGIPPQLYAQLMCQVDLLHDIVNRSITYYAQRAPSTLAEIRWRIDQKSYSKTAYEDAFEKIAPPLLQSISIREPTIFVKGFDYSHFKNYEFPDGRVPDYLEVEYGIKAKSGFNIQKLIRGNLKFEDSQSSVGIQVADLLASGIRRCLRGDFVANDAIAKAIGCLTLQNKNGKSPIHLVSFSDTHEPDQIASNVVISMSKNSKAFLSNRFFQSD